MSADLWIKKAKENNFSHLVIAKDLEEKDLFPVYFKSRAEADRYCDNIVSESKIKIIELIDLVDL